MANLLAASNVPQAEEKTIVPDELRLKVTAGPSTDTEFCKAGVLKLTVGRTRASKIWIKDSAVSEKHADIFWDGKNWALQDKGSSNGTLLNGISLDAGGMHFSGHAMSCQSTVQLSFARNSHNHETSARCSIITKKWRSCSVWHR